MWRSFFVELRHATSDCTLEQSYKGLGVGLADDGTISSLTISRGVKLQTWEDPYALYASMVWKWLVPGCKCRLISIAPGISHTGA